MRGGLLVNGPSLSSAHWSKAAFLARHGKLKVFSGSTPYADLYGGTRTRSALADFASRALRDVDIDDSVAADTCPPPLAAVTNFSVFPEYVFDSQALFSDKALLSGVAFPPTVPAVTTLRQVLQLLLAAASCFLLLLPAASCCFPFNC